MESSQRTNRIPGQDKAAAGSKEEQPDLLAALLRTREVNRRLRETLLAMLHDWAGDGRVKGAIATLLSWFLTLLFKPEKDFSAPAVQEVLRQPEHAQQLMQGIPLWINSGLEAAQALHEGNVADGKKTTGFSDLLSRIDTARAGTLLSDILQQANSMHQNTESPLSEKLKPAIENWIGHVDYGELKQRAEQTGDDLVDLTKTVNEQLWRYPAKMICLFSTLPVAVNTGIKSLEQTLIPINQLPPDLAADVLSELLRELDAEHVGKLANEVLELLRKLSTGSELISKPGNSKLVQDASGLFERMLAEMDVTLLVKVRGLLREQGERLEQLLDEQMETHPELLQEEIEARFKRQSIGARRMARRIDSLERCFSDDELAQQIQQGMDGIDPQQAADTLNRAMSLLNRMRERQPELLNETLGQFVNALDPMELAELLRTLGEEFNRAIEPLAADLLPPLVHTLAQSIRQAKERENGELTEALDQLRRALATTEEAA